MLQDKIAHEEMAQARQIIENLRPTFKLVRDLASRKQERDWAEEMLWRSRDLIKAISTWGRCKVAIAPNFILFQANLRPSKRGLERIWHSDALRDAYKALHPAANRIAVAFDSYVSELLQEECA